MVIPQQLYSYAVLPGAHPETQNSRDFLGALMNVRGVGAIPETGTTRFALAGPTALYSSEMVRAGEVYENPVTGERAVIRIGTDTTGGERLVVDLYVRPGGAVMGEHLHPAMEERFTMLRGQVGFRLAGRVAIAEPGVELIAPPGTPHDWWNTGSKEALVRMEMRPAARFEAMIRNAFGLAQDGKVNNRGMPNLLQLAVFAREFADVIQFTRPPRIVQRILFGLLTPLARH